MLHLLAEPHSNLDGLDSPGAVTVAVEEGSGRGTRHGATAGKGLGAVEEYLLQLAELVVHALLVGVCHGGCN